jgi:hypothetical protein
MQLTQDERAAVKAHFDAEAQDMATYQARRKAAKACHWLSGARHTEGSELRCVCLTPEQLECEVWFSKLKAMGCFYRAGVRWTPAGELIPETWPPTRFIDQCTVGKASRIVQEVHDCLPDFLELLGLCDPDLAMAKLFMEAAV